MYLSKGGSNASKRGVGGAEKYNFMCLADQNIDV
jgi:hypothetical protein